jgi:hypothetical protein
MSEDATAPVVEVTTANSSPEVTKPHVSSKPYDDDMLEAYEAETQEETKTNEQEPSQALPAKEEEVAKVDDGEPEEQKDVAKAKEGDTVDDGFENVPVKKLINGKEVEFKVKDAIQAFVKQEEFNRKMDERLSKVAHREKSWESDQTRFKDVIGKLIETAQKGDFVTAARGLAKMAAGDSGLDVVEFEKAYFDQLDKVRDVYTKLTPEQREAYFAKRALAEATEKTRKLEEARSTEVATAQLQEQVNQTIEQNGLAPEEFWESYKAIETNLVGEGKVFKDASEITTEEVVRLSLQVRHEAKVEQAVKLAGLQNEEMRDYVSHLTSKDPEITVEDIVKVIKASGVAVSAEPKAVENLNRKAGASRLRSSPQASSTKERNAEGYDQESLDFLYRKQPPVYRRPLR